MVWLLLPLWCGCGVGVVWVSCGCGVDVVSVWCELSGWRVALTGHHTDVIKKFKTQLTFGGKQIKSTRKLTNIICSAPTHTNKDTRSCYIFGLYGNLLLLLLLLLSLITRAQLACREMADSKETTTRSNNSKRTTWHGFISNPSTVLWRLRSFLNRSVSLWSSRSNSHGDDTIYFLVSASRSTAHVQFQFCFRRRQSRLIQVTSNRT